MKRIGRTFYFDSAHNLPNYNGKCKNLHGHRWRLDVYVEGVESKTTGMIVDFKDLKDIVNTNIIDAITYIDDLRAKSSTNISGSFQEGIPFFSSSKRKR